MAEGIPSPVDPSLRLLPALTSRRTQGRALVGLRTGRALLWFWAGIFSLELKTALLAAVSLPALPCPVSVLPPPRSGVSRSRLPAAGGAVGRQEDGTRLGKQLRSSRHLRAPALGINARHIRFCFGITRKNVILIQGMVMSAWLLPFSYFAVLVAFMFRTSRLLLYLCSPRFGARCLHRPLPACFCRNQECRVFSRASHVRRCHSNSFR